MPTKPRNHNQPLPGRVDSTGARRLGATAGQRKAKEIRSTYRWQQFRARFVRLRPLCCDPFGHHELIPAAAAEVHHVVALAEDPSQAFDVSNCRGLCSPCHHRIENLERRGLGTRHFFKNDTGQGPGGCKSLDFNPTRPSRPIRFFDREIGKKPENL